LGWLRKEGKGWTTTKRDFPPAKIRPVTEEEVKGLRMATAKCVEVIEQIIGVRLNYDQASLAKLDDLIDTHWAV
jgi:hypothetical protein